jgi:mycofactocin precursor
MPLGPGARGADTEGALMNVENAGTEAPAEVPTEAPAEVPTEAQDVAETEELLVEEISIDGMCGVY